MTSHDTELGTTGHIALVERYAAHNYHPLPVVLSHGEGAWVTDVEGNRYLDCLAGYSALNFGHAHPRLVARARDQLDRLTLTSRAFFSSTRTRSTISWPGAWVRSQSANAEGV